jgi:asparagine synthase (glutamine-hydrolysing)
MGGELSREAREHTVRAMMASLAHRGPDGEGLACGPAWTFGHQRLAVIDLETGAQPVWTADGRYCIAYNGEIYNYLELRQSLAREGARFRTFSDTEVLLQLLASRGTEALTQCDGMFAFALYDTAADTLTLGRDHAGIKPLYYSQAPGGGWVWASEIKALLRHPQISARPEWPGLEEYLVLQLCLGDKTLFEGVRKVMPGTVLTFKAGEPARERRWFSLSFDVDTHHTEAYFLDSLRHALRDSVKLQLRSDVAVGAYLSGGLDSSAITALATESAGGGFHCFTGRFSESDQYDESAYAGIVAAEYAADLHLVTPAPEDFVAWMPRIIWHMDEPVAGPGVFPQFMVSRAAREHVTVVLGGQGGDEIFGGYARYLAAYLEQALKGAVFATQTEGHFVVTLESIIPNLPALRQYVPMLQHLWREELFEPLPRRYFRLLDRSPDLFSLLSEASRREFSRRRVAESFRLVFDKPGITSSINKMLAFDIEVVLPTLLQVEDRASMHASLESRVPLLAPKILRLAASIPPTIKFKNGQLKHVFREAAAGFLPEAVLRRKDKMGFPVPLTEWLRQGPVREFAADLLLSRACRERGIFDGEALEALMNREGPHSRQVWGALCLELWFRIFIDGADAPEPPYAG